MDFQSSASCELKTLNSPELKRNCSHGHWTRQFVRYSIAPTIRHRDRVPSWTANAAITLSHSLSFYTLPPQGNRRLPFAVCDLHLRTLQLCDKNYYANFICREIAIAIAVVIAISTADTAPLPHKIKDTEKMPKTWGVCKSKGPEQC